MRLYRLSSFGDKGELLKKKERFKNTGLLDKIREKYKSFLFLESLFMNLLFILK